MIYLVRRLGKLQVFTARMSQNGPDSCSYGMPLVCSRRLLRELERDTRLLEPGNVDCNAARKQAESFLNALLESLLIEYQIWTVESQISRLIC